MKRLMAFIMCGLVLFCASCSSEKEYSLSGKTLDVTFEDGKISLRGILKVGDGFIEFSPETPSGLLVRITSEGGEVSYKGMSFDGVVALSRFLPVFEAIQKSDFTTSFGNSAYPDTIEGNDFKLTIHKEISSK